jgi:hypothetical protein
LAEAREGSKEGAGDWAQSGPAAHSKTSGRSLGSFMK